MKPTIYLAHKYEQRPLGRVYQQLFEKAGATVINPFDRAEQEIYNKVMENDCDFTPYAKDIVNADLGAISQSNAVAAMVFPNAIGTVMEIMYAYEIGLPVFTYVGYSMPYKHPWLAYHSKQYTDIDKWAEAVSHWIQDPQGYMPTDYESCREETTYGN